ncbi:MAG: ABC transporter permease subunit [Oscillospiraceae bacterium]|nr:ABC transporter permease subunit [Oscillospiraceae bacterium]
MKKHGLLYKIGKQKELIFIALPFFVYTFIFSYYPLWGWLMAFQNYRSSSIIKFWEQEWVGLQQFKTLFGGAEFPRVIRNTLGMGVINLVLHFVSAILFALLLNELFTRRFKRVVQTISYLPHFLSMIIVVSLAQNMLSMEDGVINQALLALGLVQEKVHFMGNPNYFWWIIGFTNVWKEMGWNTIIYLASITSIDPTLYEAADIDGANRLQKNMYITLPGIKSTIVILLILNVGWVLNVGFEMPYLFRNGFVADVANTIDIYVVEKGMSRLNFSLATAAGMFKTVVSIVLIGFCNWIAGRMGEEKLI